MNGLGSLGAIGEYYAEQGSIIHLFVTLTSSLRHHLRRILYGWRVGSRWTYQRAIIRG